jgi:hypothetical protein
VKLSHYADAMRSSVVVRAFDRAYAGKRAMRETTTGAGVEGSAKARTVSHFMKGPVAVEILLAQHGEANARRIALREQRKARRARSRRRFNFWVAVATLIGHRCSEQALSHEPGVRDWNAPARARAAVSSAAKPLFDAERCDEAVGVMCGDLG